LAVSFGLAPEAIAGEQPGVFRRASCTVGRIDIVVVYKVDRLSRSLLGFHKLIEMFERRNTTFVSITQSFNTTDAMGRMHMNIMLTFAQYEREVTGERIRDKVAASRKKGM
jgi:DNA invertase Pin-like site-specific DNA recombinase